MQFGGGGTSTFTAAPSAGSPTLPIGTGSFAGGAAPAFQGTAVLGVNMASGYANQLASFQVAGVQQFSVANTGIVTIGSTTGSSLGGYQVNVPGTKYGGLGGGGAGFIFAFDNTGWFGIESSTSVASMGGALHLPVKVFGNGNALFQGSTGFSTADTGNLLTAISDSATKTAFVARSAASNTADIVQVQDGASVNQFGVMNIGTGPAPIYALRVAPVANTASMAQTHAGGASTGKAIQIVDNAGTTLGWLQLLA